MATSQTSTSPVQTRGWVGLHEMRKVRREKKKKWETLEEEEEKQKILLLIDWF